METTPAVLDFLEAVGRAWGRAWQETLAREIGRGTFTHLDGEPCLVGPRVDRPVTSSVGMKQLRLGAEAA